MFKLFEIFVVLVLFKCCLTVKLEYPIYFAEDICDDVLTIGSEPNNSSLIIKLMKNNSSKTFKSCRVEIITTNDRKIHTNIKKMIDSFKKRVFHSPNSVILTEVNDNRHVIIEFHGLGDDLELVVTTYHPVVEGQNCPKKYFLCEENKCIHEVFRCDTHFNCDNDENELACALDLTPGDTVLLTIILAILSSLFGTTCLLSTYVYFSYYHKRQRLLDSKQIMYGTVNTSTAVSVQHSMKVYK